MLAYSNATKFFPGWGSKSDTGSSPARRWKEAKPTGGGEEEQIAEDDMAQNLYAEPGEYKQADSIVQVEFLAAQKYWAFREELARHSRCVPAQ